MTFDSEYSPWFQPPSWVIGPVWTFLYICMGVSVSLAWISREGLENSNLVFGLFIAQLTLNLLWPQVFNSASYAVSLIMLLGMIAFTAYYAMLVYDVSRVASMLVWPYIAWMSFASLINVAYLWEAIG